MTATAKSKLIIDLIEKNDPTLVKKVHGFLVDEGVILEDARSQDDNEIQMREYLNPKPDSRYFESDWPKGIAVFAHITTVVTIVLHGLRVVVNNNFWTQERVLLVSLALVTMPAKIK